MHPLSHMLLLRNILTHGLLNYTSNGELFDTQSESLYTYFAIIQYGQIPPGISYVPLAERKHLK